MEAQRNRYLATLHKNRMAHTIIIRDSTPARKAGLRAGVGHYSAHLAVTPYFSPWPTRFGASGTATPAAVITFANAATVTGDGLKFPNRNPCAITSGVQPCLLGRFQTSIFAPFAARNSTAFG